MFVAATTLDKPILPEGLPGLQAAMAPELQARKADVAFLDGHFFTHERGEAAFLKTDDYLKFLTSSESHPPASAGVILDWTANPFIPSNVDEVSNTTYSGQVRIGSLEVDPYVAVAQKTPDLMNFKDKRSKREGEGKIVNEKQKVWRREKNREHAKQSRIRKKLFEDSLQKKKEILKNQNEKLREAIKAHLGEAGVLITQSAKTEPVHDQDVSTEEAFDAKTVVEKSGFSLKVAQSVQHNFVITDPTLPDNPIIYATQGFLSLTGYTLDQIRGHNCSFLQGPATDGNVAEKICNAFTQGIDMSAVVLHYRSDGTAFWSNVSIAPLCDEDGNISNFLVDFMIVSELFSNSSSAAVKDIEDASVTRKVTNSPVSGITANNCQGLKASIAVDGNKSFGDPQAMFIKLVG
jgi:PAS domain S-box-containing protein